MARRRIETIRRNIITHERRLRDRARTVRAGESCSSYHFSLDPHTRYAASLLRSCSSPFSNLVHPIHPPPFHAFPRPPFPSSSIPVRIALYPSWRVRFAGMRCCGPARHAHESVHYIMTCSLIYRPYVIQCMYTPPSRARHRMVKTKTHNTAHTAEWQQRHEQNNIDSHARHAGTCTRPVKDGKNASIQSHQGKI